MNENNEEAAGAEVNAAVIVAYHNNCIDGFTSAWVAHVALEAEGYEVILVPMDYDDRSINNLSYLVEGREPKEVYLVDYSVDKNTFLNLCATYPDTKFTILDHHKTAFERYAPDMEIKADSILSWCPDILKGNAVHLDNALSGAGICWKYFNLGCTMPDLVAYVQDYDLWQFKLGAETKWFNKYLGKEEKTIENWSLISKRIREGNIGYCLTVGKELQWEHDTTITLLASASVPITLAGFRGEVVDIPEKQFASDVGEALAKKSGTFGACIILDLKAGLIHWSLRSDKASGFDVTTICKKYGGGGHKNAGGFTTDLIGAPND